MIEKEREFLHSWYIFVITFLSLFFLLLNKKFSLDLFLFSVVLFIFFKNGLRFSSFKKLFIFAFLFSAGIFILNILYPAKELQAGEIYNFFHMRFYQASMHRAQQTMFRLFLVSLLSMSSSVVIDYTKVILHLIVHKGLKLFWGYPILLALNSIVLFKEEFNRIRINAKLRELPLRERLTIFFPLLVFAIRHSQRGALSLVTRGLNEKKSFYFSYDLSDSDKKRLRLFVILYFVLVWGAVSPLKLFF